jgi:hypothetical protein
MSLGDIVGSDLFRVVAILGGVAGLAAVMNFLANRQKPGEGGSYRIDPCSSSDGGGGDGGGD